MARPRCRRLRVSVCRDCSGARSGAPARASAGDIAGTMGALTAAASRGEITPGEAAELAKVVDTLLRSIETSDFDRRLKELEDESKADAERRAVAGVGWYNR